MSYLCIQFFRCFVRFFPKLGLKIANALRIRSYTGWLFNRQLEVPYYGVRLKVSCIEWIGFFIYVGRCYECVVLDIIRKYALNYKVFFDVGSNLGLHALVLAHSNREARVIGFEPIPDLHAQFSANIRLNSDLKNVSALCLGVADKTDLFQFDLKLDERCRGNASLICEAKVPEASKMWVSCYSFLDVSQKLNLWPDFIKIDVEGAELILLNGLKDAVKNGKSAPDLLVEVHGWMYHPHEKDHSDKVLAILHEMNYFIWLIVEENEKLIIQEDMRLPIEIQSIDEKTGLHGRAMLLASRDKNRFASFTP